MGHNVERNLKKYDVILVAGEGKSSYKVCHQHKAFLRLGGKCVVNHVLTALQQVFRIAQIHVVGPREKLLRHMAEDGINMATPKKIRVFEQRKNLYENIWHTFLDTLPESVEEAELENSIFRDRAILVVPCDSPLMTPHEVEYFIAQADMENYDHVLGLTPEKSMEPFYPKGDQPGIQMAYLHLRENRYRINNLHLVKPIRIKNRHYIQQMYNYRYQRNLKNVLLFGRAIIGKDKRNRYRYYIALLLGLLFSWMKLRPLADFCRAWVPQQGLEDCISNIMGTRFKGLEVPFPGAALDIDNARDFEVMKLQLHTWQKHIKNMDPCYPIPSTHNTRPSTPVTTPDATGSVPVSKIDTGTLP